MLIDAAVLVETGRPLVLARLSVPALKPGQVLVEIDYSGACSTQVMEMRGLKGEDRWLPHCLGHEGVGRVLEIGPSVSRVRPGDAVVLSWIKAGGVDAGGAVYDWEGRRVNAGAVTTFQRHAVVSENRLTLAPAHLSPDLAVLLGCAAPTGMGAVFNVLKASAGQSVAVFGAGGVGLCAVYAAASAGAHPVIAIDPNPSRRALALTFGATHTIDASVEDLGAAIRDISSVGVDLAVEASGRTDVMALALSSVRQQGGRAVVIGNARYGAELKLDPGLFNQGKSLMGTWGGDSQPDRDYARYGALIASEPDRMRGLQSTPYRLEQINEALDDLASGRIGRPLIDMHLS